MNISPIVAAKLAFELTLNNSALSGNAFIKAASAPKSINPLPILLNVTEVNNAIFFSNILIVN